MNIDEILKAPDFSLDEINIGDYLDTVSFPQREETLRKILVKLNPYGEISLSGTDIGTITSVISKNIIGIPEANSILENIKSMTMLNDVERFFYQNNFKVVKKNIEGYGKYFLSARHAM